MYYRLDYIYFSDNVLPGLKRQPVFPQMNPILLQVWKTEMEKSQLPLPIIQTFTTLNKKKPKIKHPIQANVSSGKCPHDKRTQRCRDCNGNAFCTLHGVRKEICKDCGGSSICNHKRERRMCKDCKALGIGGTSLCEHYKKKSYCNECK